MGIELDAPAMTGEDFARYLSLKPGAFGWLGTTKENGEFHPLHSSHFAGNEDVLPRGAARRVFPLVLYHIRAAQARGGCLQKDALSRRDFPMIFFAGAPARVILWYNIPRNGQAGRKPPGRVSGGGTAWDIATGRSRTT